MAQTYTRVRRLGLAIGNALCKLDFWIERLLVWMTLIAIATLSIVIAWGLIAGKYFIVRTY